MLLLWLACNKPDIKLDPKESGYIDKHSEVIDDSGDSSESGSDSPADSDDSDTGQASSLVRLDVVPQGLTVAVGASWSMQVVGTDSDGRRDWTTASRWYSDDEAVATIDTNGLVVTTGPGSTWLHAERDGLEAGALLTVREDGLVQIQAIDGRDGTGLGKVTVTLPDGSTGTTDADGKLSLPWADPGPLTLTAYKPKFNGVAFVDTVSRSIVFTTFPKEQDLQDATLHGQVDLSAVPEGDWDQLVVGMGGAGAQGELAGLILEDLLGEDRELTVLGATVHAPGNLFIKGTVEDYQTQIWSEPVVAWGLAGALDIASLTAATGVGEVMRMLTQNLDDFRWGYAGGGVGTTGGTTELDLAMATPFDQTMSLLLPALPSGFNGTEAYFLMSAQERVDGWVVDGFGEGQAGEQAVLHRVAAGSVEAALGEAVLLYNEVGGLGTSGTVATAIAENYGGSWESPDLLAIPTLDSWDAAGRSIALTVDSRSNYVRLRAFDRHKLAYDIYLPGSYTGPLPAADPDFLWEDADLQVISAESTLLSREDSISTGLLDPRQQQARRMVRAGWSF
ncbi:MAG TPA: Ig-like domain-containing protein [Myxococcota bacterium]|nr:Ig-like domain-containing protein [Myxococcota bacterium]